MNPPASTNRHPLNPQGLRPGETCEECYGEPWQVHYSLGFACGVSVWQKNLPWSTADREKAKTEGCGLCCGCQD